GMSPGITSRRPTRYDEVRRRLGGVADGRRFIRRGREAAAEPAAGRVREAFGDSGAGASAGPAPGGMGPATGGLPGASRVRRAGRPTRGPFQPPEDRGGVPPAV